MSRRVSPGPMKAKAGTSSATSRKPGQKPSQKSAVIDIEMGPEDAKIVLNTISSENYEMPRARAGLSATPTGIRLEINADDTGALRATINSYMRWIKIACEVAALEDCGKRSGK